MGVTEFFLVKFTLNIKYPPCCDVIVAIATAVKSSFFKIPNSLVIVLYQSGTLCFKTNNNFPEIKKCSEPPYVLFKELLIRQTLKIGSFLHSLLLYFCIV